MDDVFDPYTLLQALERQRVTYIVIGALGRVIQGSDEVTSGLDIVPSTRTENLRRLGLALDQLNARGRDGRLSRSDATSLARARSSSRPTRASSRLCRSRRARAATSDLRRRAERQPLGQGLRPSVAALDDHARMIAALDRDHDRERLATVQRLIELERELRRGRSIEL